MLNQKLTELLRNEIALGEHIGLAVLESDTLSVTLSAPLAKNNNHKGTAFGGSLYSLSVLSGWALVTSTLIDEGLEGHGVIQKSSTQFLHPVSTDIVAKCAYESGSQRERFLNMYRRKGVARVELEATIESQGKLCVLFTGEFVAKKSL